MIKNRRYAYKLYYYSIYFLRNKSYFSEKPYQKQEKFAERLPNLFCQGGIEGIGRKKEAYGKGGARGGKERLFRGNGRFPWGSEYGQRKIAVKGLFQASYMNVNDEKGSKKTIQDK